MSDYMINTPSIPVLMPVAKSVLHIVPNFKIEFVDDMPNRWRRFWYRVLLGWTWSKL